MHIDFLTPNASVNISIKQAHRRARVVAITSVLTLCLLLGLTESVTAFAAAHRPLDPVVDRFVIVESEPTAWSERTLVRSSDQADVFAMFPHDNLFRRYVDGSPNQSVSLMGVSFGGVYLPPGASDVEAVIHSADPVNAALLQNLQLVAKANPLDALSASLQAAPSTWFD